MHSCVRAAALQTLKKWESSKPPILPFPGSPHFSALGPVLGETWRGSGPAVLAQRPGVRASRAQ